MFCACRLLAFLLFFASAAAAQSGLTIDKIGKEPVRSVGNTVAFTTVMEGIVSDADLSVYVLVKSPGAANERIFAAAVDSSQPDKAGGYRWRAVCQFGEIMGAAGGTYEVRAAAINPAGIQRGKLLEVLKAGKVKTNAITLTRTGN